MSIKTSTMRKLAPGGNLPSEISFRRASFLFEFRMNPDFISFFYSGGKPMIKAEFKSVFISYPSHRPMPLIHKKFSVPFLQKGGKCSFNYERPFVLTTHLDNDVFLVLAYSFINEKTSCFTIL